MTVLDTAATMVPRMPPTTTRAQARAETLREQMKRATLKFLSSSGERIRLDVRSLLTLVPPTLAASPPACSRSIALHHKQRAHMRRLRARRRNLRPFASRQVARQGVVADRLMW